MEHLLKMYQEYSDRKFDEIREDIHEIRQKMDEIHEFKVTSIATSRTVSMIVSAVCGLVTLLVTSFLTIKFH